MGSQEADEGVDTGLIRKFGYLAYNARIAHIHACNRKGAKIHTFGFRVVGHI